MMRPRYSLMWYCHSITLPIVGGRKQAREDRDSNLNQVLHYLLRENLRLKIMPRPFWAYR
jgi:hypothetical protein